MSTLTIYTVTGKETQVLWLFKYDLNGLLREFKLEEGQLDSKQVAWLFHKDRFPYHESIIKGWKAIKNFEITIGIPDLSFDTFFDLYGHRIKKQQATKSWERLSQKDKMDAIKYIKIYDNYLARKRVAKTNPATYLNQRYWEDDHGSIH